MSDNAARQTPINVAVIGGGIAGLSAAWTLSRESPDAQITVYEASSRVGGKIQTSPFAGFDVDTGPDAFLARVPWAVELCDQLGIRDELVSPATSKAWLWSRNRLVRYPEKTVLGVPGDLRALRRSHAISGAGLARVSLEPLVPANFTGEDVSIGSFITRRFGLEIANRLVDPLVGGINGGSIRNLSLRSAAPQIAALATQPGGLLKAARRQVRKTAAGAPSPVFFGLPGGMARLVGALYSQLQAAGTFFETGRSVQRLERVHAGWRLIFDDKEVLADAVVCATPAAATAALLREAVPSAAVVLREVESSTVTLVRLAYPKTAFDAPLDGSGFVVPAVDGKLLTACSWASSKWSHLDNSEHVVFRASVGRHGHDPAAAIDDGELIDAVHQALTVSIGVRRPPVEADSTRWIDAFPQYTVGHAARVERIRAAIASTPGLALAGAAYEGIGVPACIRSGILAARSLTQSAR